MVHVEKIVRINSMKVKCQEDDSVNIVTCIELKHKTKIDVTFPDLW